MNRTSLSSEVHVVLLGLRLLLFLSHDLETFLLVVVASSEDTDNLLEWQGVGIVFLLLIDGHSSLIEVNLFYLLLDLDLDWDLVSEWVTLSSMEVKVAFIDLISKFGVILDLDWNDELEFGILLDFPVNWKNDLI